MPTVRIPPSTYSTSTADAGREVRAQKRRCVTHVLDGHIALDGRVAATWASILPNPESGLPRGS